VSRQVAFFKRVLSPAVLLEPLPPALRLSLTRNFSFFTKIFTQFFGAPAWAVRTPPA
jgi:hypothetical protein